MAYIGLYVLFKCWI